MFSDLILQTKVSGGSSTKSKKGQDVKYQYVDSIPFSKYMFRDEDRAKDILNVRFYLVEKEPERSKKPVIKTFECLSEVEKNGWVSDIAEAISVHQFMGTIHDDSIRQTLVSSKQQEHALIQLDLGSSFLALHNHGNDLEVHLLAMDHVIHIIDYVKIKLEEDTVVLVKKDFLGQGNAIDDRLETLRKALLCFSPFGEHSAPLNVEVHRKAAIILQFLLTCPVSSTHKEKVQALKRLVCDK